MTSFALICIKNFPNRSIWVFRSFLQSLITNSLFQCIILVEPLISPKGDAYLLDLRTELIRSAYERRDSWDNREDARTQLLRNPLIKAWSPLVFDCYVVGFYRYFSEEWRLSRQHRNMHFVLNFLGLPKWRCAVVVKKKLWVEFVMGVILEVTWSMVSSQTMYRDPDGATKFIPDLNKACACIPVHIIFGAVNDYMSIQLKRVNCNISL